MRAGELSPALVFLLQHPLESNQLMTVPELVPINTFLISGRLLPESRLVITHPQNNSDAEIWKLFPDLGSFRFEVVLIEERNKNVTSLRRRSPQCAVH